MKFIRTEFLFLIWIIPLLALVYLYGERKRRRILNAFARARTRARILPAGMQHRRIWRAVLVLCAAVLVIFAIAGPQYGFQWQEIERRGIDIVIALDCSRSMLAADIQPTRLDRAKREIYDLLAMLQGDRVGLVAFSGTAFLQCPLTIDYPAFYLFLDVLTPDYLPVGGSDLAAALQTAREAFDPESRAEKAIIMITDGEHTGRGDPLEAARAAQKEGIKLFCIGVGSGDGVPVPDTGGGFKKDAAGSIVLSRLDESALSRMALATGGAYVRSVAGDMDLETIYLEQIRARMDAATVESGRRKIWADRFQWPLALAILLLFVVRWIPLARRPMAGLALAAVLLMPHGTAHAGPLQDGLDAYAQGAYDRALKQFIQGQLQDPDNPEVLYNIGNAYYKNGNFQAAKEHYLQALPKASAGLKPRLRYNLGNSAYRLGALEEAVENYEAALQLAPDDRQAEENLEFVKKQLKKQQQQNTSEKEQNPQNDSQDSTQNQRSPAESENQPSENESMEGNASRQNQTPEEKERQRQSAPDPGERQRPSAADQRLNRLKDQPGRALMPDYGKQPVEKDW